MVKRGKYSEDTYFNATLIFCPLSVKSTENTQVTIFKYNNAVGRRYNLNINFTELPFDSKLYFVWVLLNFLF